MSTKITDFTELRQWRLDVVAQILLIPVALLDVFWSSQVGKKVFQLACSDLLYEELNEEEELLLYKLKDSCFEGTNTEKMIPSWMAVQLFLLPHQVETSLRLGEIIKSLPSDLIDVGLCLLLRKPKIVLEVGEADRYADFLQNLTADVYDFVACTSFPLRKLLARTFLSNHNFIPLYFSLGNMRKVMEQRSAILELVVGSENREIPLDFESTGSKTGGSRLRLGFFVPQLSPKAETYVTIPFFRELDRAHFSVHIFTVDLCSDESELYFRSMVDELTLLPQNVWACVEKIRFERMDMIIFTTNLTQGTGFSATLAAHRMAPAQIVETCCPVTTGLKNIDYYFSGSFTEPPDAAESYSEKLIMLEGPAQAYHLFPENPVLQDGEKWDREALGIPEDAVVFISGANANKIIPELRLLWARILAAVPGSYMILYPFNKNWQTEYPVSPFMRSLLGFGDQCGVDGRRWKVLMEPFESREELLSMISNADVYLDSIRHSGAVSMLDPLLVGLPPVVIEGCFGRGRQASAILRSLGLNDYVCQTDDDYFNLAVRLGRNLKDRQAYAALVRERMADDPEIFDCHRYAAKIEKVLRRIAKRHFGDERGKNSF